MTGLEGFVASHPYWTYLILFGGMFVEGELFFLMGAIFAWRGHLEWLPLFASIFVGVILGDIAWYGLGKYVRNTKFGSFFAKKIKPFESWMTENFMSRYQRLAFYSKFIYYVNRIVPLMAGWQRMKFKKFAKVHFWAACLWVSVVGTTVYLASYFIGPEGARWLLRRIEWVIIAAIVLVVGSEFLLKKTFIKRISKFIKNLNQS